MPLKARLVAALHRLLDKADDLYDREPVRFNTAVVAVIVAAGGALGFAVDGVAIALPVSLVLGLLFNGTVTRAAVVSAKTHREIIAEAVELDPNAELPDDAFPDEPVDEPPEAGDVDDESADSGHTDDEAVE